MKKLQAKLQTLLSNQKGAFSIEMLIVIGIIVVLVILAMTAFARESSEISNQYDNNVSDALTQQTGINNKLTTQKNSISTKLSFN